MAFSVITSGSIPGAADGATTGSLNTSDANLIIVLVTRYTAGSPVTLSDSKMNNWTPLFEQATAVLGAQLYYCSSPVVGGSHTFQVAGTGSFSGLAVLALAGAASSSPFDVQNGNTGSANTFISAGIVTPSEANEIVVTGVMTNDNTDFDTAAVIDNSFIISSRVASIPSTSFAFGLAYKIQVSAVAENPTWSWTSAYVNGQVANIASFKAGTGGTPSAVLSPVMSILAGSGNV